MPMNQAFINQLNRELPGLMEDSGTLTDYKFQKRYANTLKHTAHDHLLNGQSVVAKNFQGYYHGLVGAIDDDVKLANESFIQQQSQCGIPGTDVELSALAAKFGFSVIVEWPEHNTEYCLYRTEDDSAPVMRIKHEMLKSREGKKIAHYSYNDKTIVDGRTQNCLYYSVAQFLQSACKEYNQPKQIGNRYQIFPPIQYNKKEVASQLQEFELIQQQPKPSEIEADLEKENTRISKLSEDEQKQILGDHKYALQVAADEVTQIEKLSERVTQTSLLVKGSQSASKVASPLPA